LALGFYIESNLKKKKKRERKERERKQAEELRLFLE